MARWHMVGKKKGPMDKQACRQDFAAVAAHSLNAMLDVCSNRGAKYEMGAQILKGDAGNHCRRPCGPDKPEAFRVNDLLILFQPVSFYVTTERLVTTPTQKTATNGSHCLNQVEMMFAIANYCFRPNYVSEHENKTPFASQFSEPCIDTSKRSLAWHLAKLLENIYVGQERRGEKHSRRNDEMIKTLYAHAFDRTSRKKVNWEKTMSWKALRKQGLQHS